MTGCWIVSLDVSVGTLLLHTHTLRHWWLSPSAGGIAGPYETRLRQLCLSQASSLSTETHAVSPQRLGSFRVPSPSLRPRHWRPHNTTLAASARTGRLQSGCYGILCIAWSCPTLRRNGQLARVADLPSRRRHRSSSSHQLHVPSFRLSTVGRRSFPVAAAILWNTLPADVQSSPLTSGLPPASEDIPLLPQIISWCCMTGRLRFRGLSNGLLLF